MSFVKSCPIVLGFLVLLSPLLGCAEEKSCDEWYQDVAQQCCAGRANCAGLDSKTKSDFDGMCKTGEDNCGNSLECKGTPSGTASCVVECGCGN